MKTHWFVFSALLLAGCGGGSGVECCLRPPQPPAISAQPASLSFPYEQGTGSETVSLSGGTPPYSVLADDAQYIDVSAPSSSSGEISFNVTPVAGGSTAITVRDSGGNELSIPVTIRICVPPAPALWLVYPAPSATAVPVSFANVWSALETTDPLLAYVGEVQTRLIGSDGSTIRGGNFVKTNATPPPGSAIPPASAGGFTYTYVYLTSPVAALKSGLNYSVQMTIPTETCLPPMILGKFST